MISAVGVSSIRSFIPVYIKPLIAPHMLDVVHGLNTNYDRYICSPLLLMGGIPKAAQAHRVLLKLCRQQNVEKFVSVLREHILDAADAIKHPVVQQVD